MAAVALLGTCDTKLAELLFLREQMLDAGVRVLLIDVGRSEVQHECIHLGRTALVARYGGDRSAEQSRGELIRFMAGCAAGAVRAMYEDGLIQGVMAIGGSGGTSLAAAAMRGGGGDDDDDDDEILPIGFPKLIVSTVASGDTGAIVGETDLTLMYPVVDIAGLNGVLTEVLANAAAAMAGMALSYARRHGRVAEAVPAGLGQHEQGQAEDSKSKKVVGITMFGVTTPAVEAARRRLEARCAPGTLETLVFHATGRGGRAMERLVRQGRLHGVLDLTTTEVCDFVAGPGATMSAGPHRLEAAAAAGLPCVVSVGATDMVNFGPRATVPERYTACGRLLYEHNPVVTLMRTSPDECRQIGSFIGAKLRHATRPDLVQVWLPRGGVSALSTPGGPFFDAAADEALFSAVRDGLDGTLVSVVDDPRHINDEGFAADMADALLAKMGIT